MMVAAAVRAGKGHQLRTFQPTDCDLTMVKSEAPPHSAHQLERRNVRWSQTPSPPGRDPPLADKIFVDGRKGTDWIVRPDDRVATSPRLVCSMNRPRGRGSHRRRRRSRASAPKIPGMSSGGRALGGRHDPKYRSLRRWPVDPHEPEGTLVFTFDWCSLRGASNVSSRNARKKIFFLKKKVDAMDLTTGDVCGPAAFSGSETAADGNYFQPSAAGGKEREEKRPQGVATSPRSR